MDAALEPKRHFGQMALMNHLCKDRLPPVPLQQKQYVCR
jgi:hypothetical protein